MSGNLKFRCLLAALLQMIPLLIVSAQEDLIYKGPVVPDPVPSKSTLGNYSPSEDGRILDSVQPVNSLSTRTYSSAGGESQIQQDFLRGSQEGSSYIQVLNFWFGELIGPDFLPQNKMMMWFGKDPEIDRQISDNFEQYLVSAERGEFNSWRATARGRLALVLLLDQFPRHIYRNRSQEFILDRMARALVLEGIQKGDDKKLYPIERAFFYLPLEHSEDQELQNLSVTKYRQLLSDSPEQLKPQMEDFLQTAIIHQQQIARFGRFPYRNVILGRESTPEETLFLMQSRNPK